jgi:tripartite-type tricarboxylate transporter receptor subunit TctC
MLKSFSTELQECCADAGRRRVGLVCRALPRIVAGDVAPISEEPNMNPQGRPALRRLVLISVCAAALLTIAQPQARAAYPERPVTMIVPFAPAGPTDIIARILGNQLSQRLGQQFVVDNRTGASGNTGLGQAARATPDGYTLLVTSTAIAVNAALFKKIPYDPLKDFAPISELVNAPNVLVVRADSDLKTIADLVAQAKANPTKFNYSHPGAGTKSHLTAELLKLRAGIEMVGVPYRGAGPAVTAVLEGTVQVCSTALAAAESLIQGGKLRVLAVTSEKRWFSLPNVPTMIEQGFPAFVSDTFNAVLAPAAVPQPIIDVLVKESRAAFQRPDVREASRKAGFEVVAGSPEELMARIKAEIPAVRELIARAGIPQQ